MNVERSVWLASALASVALMYVLYGLWVTMNHFEGDPTQLPDKAAVLDYFEGENISPTHRIETGIYIQSLNFLGASDVRLSGYIWQHFQDDIHDHLKPSQGEVGFVLPESVDTSGGVIKEVYRYRHSDNQGEVIGWFFEQTLRQTFDYTTYPFDHKTVWVRFWPQNFEHDIVFIPDFGAYGPTGPKDIFGIDERIVMGTWERQNTYFDYKRSDLSSSLGVPLNQIQESQPELHYNIVIKRKFENAFILHMIPLFVVTMLLFGAMMTVTRHQTLIDRHDFSTSSVIGTCSVLFFVVLLAHVQLREGFAGSPVIYMEYFYFLMYFLLLAVSVNTYLFAAEAAQSLWVIHFHDNLIPKALFWPLVLAGMVAISWYSLETGAGFEKPAPVR